MSADAWRVCPQCAARGINKKEELPKAADVYGKVSAAEYERIKKAEEDVAEYGEEEETTLREDYEIFMQENGELYISYSGHCSQCGFEAKFKLEKQYPITLEKKKK